MPGTLVSNFSVSTDNCLRSIARPHSAIGPSFGLRPKNTSSISSGKVRTSPSGVVICTPVRRPSDSSMPVGWPMTNCMRPAATSSFIFAALAGAPEKPSRRCTIVRLAARCGPSPAKLSVQSRAESPPPTITRCLPANCDGSRTR